MKYIPIRLFILVLGWMLISCGGESTSPPSQKASTPPEQSPSSTPAASTPDMQEDAKGKITTLLLSYYNDLSQEKLDETQYFAPTLDQFFSSQNVPRASVANSVRKGFESLESRSITLDRQSLMITPKGSGYIAEFKGTSTVKRTGDTETNQEPFHNRVGFNEDFLIVSYEAASAPTSTRQVAPNTSGPSVLAVANAILPEFRTARFAKTHQYIHPQKGYYLVTHPGAVSIPFQYTKVDDLFKQAPWLKKGMTQLSATTKEEALPDFDCEDFFSKEGSFLNEVPSFDEVSSLMATLVQYELGSFDEKQMDTARDLEQYVTHALIDTEESIALYFGQIEGQWYLLVIDIASYDCSA